MSSLDASRVLLVGGGAPAAVVRSSLAAVGQRPVVVLCRPAVAARLAGDVAGSVVVESAGSVSGAVVADRVRAGRFDRVLVVPGAGVGPTAIRAALGDAAVPISAAGRPRHRRLRRVTGTPQRVALFLVSFGFYLLIGDVTGFDVVTGALSALVAVALLSRVTFVDSPRLRRSLPRALRAVLFLPYLLWQIALANVALAAVLLRPSLPIDPSLECVETAADSDLERAVLANSITLTPGTLTLDVRGSTLLVHALTASSRADLRAGTLESAVRFVFAGRDARSDSDSSSGTATPEAGEDDG